MARTPSTMVELGTPLPAFSLPDTVTHRTYQDSQFLGKPLVVAFICNHCPYVQLIEAELMNIARSYGARGISFLAISSNDPVQYPQDSPEEMRKHAVEMGYPFPYLFDATQEVARAFDAACTPDFFVYDSSGRLFYRGQLDDARPKSDLPVTGHDLRHALDELLRGGPAPEFQRPSIGCNIKWKTA